MWKTQIEMMCGGVSRFNFRGSNTGSEPFDSDLKGGCNRDIHCIAGLTLLPLHTFLCKGEGTVMLDKNTEPLSRLYRFYTQFHEYKLSWPRK